MAPDLNSVPHSPPTTSGNPLAVPNSSSASQSRQASMPSSRRTSQIFPMNPPPLPLGSSGGVPPAASPGHLPFPPLSPAVSGGMAAHEPVRHPRPMTAAELHLELEKEQEAVVNRLTRELSALRAHSASVASTTSSTSTAPNLLLDPSDPSSGAQGLPLANGPTHPTASRRNRSSSNASMRNHPGRSSSTSVTSGVGNSGVGNSGVVPTTPRLDDVAFHRHELEEVKKENDRLRRRVRELEQLVRGRRASSVSTSASSAAEMVRGRSGPSGEDNA